MSDAQANTMYLRMILSLLGSLGEKLTGKTALLCTEDEEGSIGHVYLDTFDVHWLPHDAPMVCPIHSQESFWTKEFYERQAQKAARAQDRVQKEQQADERLWDRLRDMITDAVGHQSQPCPFKVGDRVKMVHTPSCVMTVADVGVSGAYVFCTWDIFGDNRPGSGGYPCPSLRACTTKEIEEETVRLAQCAESRRQRKAPLGVAVVGT